MKNNYMLLIFAGLLLLLFTACKTSTVKPKSKITILGKWFLTKHELKLFRDTAQVGFSTKTSFTTDDFSEFFDDGTGINSFKSLEPTAGLYRFTYKLDGTKLTVATDGGTGIPETVTSLTETKFNVHYELIVADPYDHQPDRETDDYEYVR